ncbi:MAG: DNA-3-methyladenine glycosylase [Pseudanabaena sp.]|jgi:DNA-3-methyladenine glycosylase|uniref:DNA-3-methyladenine glycosylase n=1 Tax=Pseudanabaena mucicola TaxID=71190 RepID=UPI002576A853|nr:DNA-3-methyladenine glycosylase [Pseudanabaena mucicola]MCA6504448.1 DNA-3-methyladenine glycosylase [Pseudanabaena sp. M090S1SP2A07QC]MCA6573243.1 DNA-3-methyladenine glycosylase [Pseudanabaena sp. M53BS1SP1A06MG]MCA6584379.1 DNA-3-methyladenine glycosylase [Pseudanabaena sp. M34BS1SP1A06MG]MCA6586279.1 DNA-3-methyladenine glycosylase [Pseudanabaena sp. M051S1SP1A06QC]MCA6590333.1 DNA-3-methyladenine glycosylase [Pseudanabaena sp. M109S1SP1A06QC]MCA6594419.1 DNA-3-methyladenine glycosylas
MLLEKAFFERPADKVAPDLLGCSIVRRIDDVEYRGLIVETEAYDATDPSCHGYRRKTKRNSAIFGAPCTAYVYLIYGIYHCVNIVTDREDFCSAVLIRSIECDRLPSWSNPKDKPHRAGAGPGKLCCLLKIDRQLDGITLHPDFDLWLEARSPHFKEPIHQTTRIGITQGIDLPWRWYLRDRLSVSRK